MLLILAMLLFAGAIALVLAAVSPSRQRREALVRARAYGDAAMATPTAGGTLPGLREETGERLARVALQLTPRTTIDSVGLRLVEAGLARRLSVTGFLASKLLCAAGGVVVGALAGVGSGNAGKALFFVLAVTVGAFFAPDAWLILRARSRRERIREQLPDALDLLAISVEAGLTFDAALSKLSDHLHGPVVDEFLLTLGEIRIGQSRHGALKGMAERTRVSEVATFVQAVIQADQLGSPLARTLRVQAEDSRKRRQAAAEEKAMKLPVKMIFPTAFLIFPALFVVILGPALLELVDFF